jgi:type II secretion system protein H
MKDRTAGAGKPFRRRSSFCVHHSAFCIPSSPGFTLMELVVVMLIMSVLFAMVAPSLGGFGAGRKAAQAASQILTLSRWAREQAITEGRTYRLVFEPVEQVYYVMAANGPVFERVGTDFGRPFSIPDGVEVTVEAPQLDGKSYLEFLPSGRSQPARVRVVSKNGQQTDLATLSATEPLRVVTVEEQQEAGLIR